MNNNINIKIQEKLDAVYDLLNDENAQENLSRDNSLLCRLRVAKEELANLYNKKAKEGKLLANDKTNILYMQIKELDFFKKYSINLNDIGKLFYDFLDDNILINDDYFLLDILNISDEIFDRYETTISNKSILEIAVKKFPDNKNFRAVYEHFTSQAESE